MYTRNDTERSANILLIATGFVLVAVLLLQSLDIRIPRDATGLPDAGPAGEDLRGNSDGIPFPPPVPPVLQKGFLR